MMNFIIVLDYACVYHSFQSVFKTNDNRFIENKICEAVIALENYVKNLIPGQKVHIAGKAAYVLNDEVYGTPEQYLQPKAGVVIKRVNEPLKRKTARMKQMNLSRQDDAVLMNDVLTVISKNNIQGVILISNDSDFYQLASKVKNSAKYFWLASMNYQSEDVSLFPGSLVRNYSDKCIPLFDVLSGKDINIERKVSKIEDVTPLDQSSIDVFMDDKLIYSYPLDKNVISIGRRSVRKRHLPDIDLSEFDSNKSISRCYASIYKSGTNMIFYIDENSSSPTWNGRYLKKAGEQFELIPDTPVVLGREKKFILVYRKR